VGILVEEVDKWMEKENENKTEKNWVEIIDRCLKSVPSSSLLN